MPNFKPVVKTLFLQIEDDDLIINLNAIYSSHTSQQAIVGSLLCIKSKEWAGHACWMDVVVKVYCMCMHM